MTTEQKETEMATTTTEEEKEVVDEMTEQEKEANATEEKEVVVVDEKTVLDYFYENVKKFGSKKRFMTQPFGAGVIKEYTYVDVLVEAKKVAAYLQTKNYPPKSRVAIMSKNCSFWVIADLGIWMAGHVSVPIYPTLTADTVRYTLEHSESVLLFIGKLDKKPWEEMKQGVPVFPDDVEKDYAEASGEKAIDLISFPLCPADTLGALSWDEAIATLQPINDADIVKRTKDEMATIIYTSGSTGKPKGVMTSFGAMTDASTGVVSTLKITQKDRYLSYLPIAHGMERWLGMCVPLYSGMELYYAESLTTFVQDLGRCRPTLFLSVPRLWTKFRQGIFAKKGEEKINKLLGIPILNIFVKRKILKALGLQCVRFAGSGSAPLPADLLVWYRSLGLELLEGYGMTENFNYSHMSMPGKTRVGYVGNTWADVDCRIDVDTGEIQVKTPGAMMGYYKNPDATAETLTEDGYVRTGDKGSLDELQRLKITGRTKEIFKTSKGKYVAPAPIESALISNPHVELACVSGKSMPQPFAMVQLSEESKLRAKRDEEFRNTLTAELEEYVKALNSKFDAHEHLQFIVLVKDDWLDTNGFLTPTQKIKRNVIEGHYESQVDSWYSMKQPVIWEDGFFIDNDDVASSSD